MSTQDPYGTPQDPAHGQPQQYGQTPGGSYPAAPVYTGEQGVRSGAPKNGIGLAALIVGIVSLLLAWVPFLGLIGIVAVVLGIIGLRRVKARVATNKGMALAGLILGILAVLAGIFWIVAAVFFAGTFGDTIENCSDPSLTEAQVQQCINDGVNDTLGS
jgi:hypothetical protein